MGSICRGLEQARNKPLTFYSVASRALLQVHTTKSVKLICVCIYIILSRKIHQNLHGVLLLLGIGILDSFYFSIFTCLFFIFEFLFCIGVEWLPSPEVVPGEFHGQRSLAGYSPWGCKESDTDEQLTLTAN